MPTHERPSGRNLAPLLGLLLFGFSSSGLATQVPLRDALELCHLPNYRQEVLCGTHTVFEDRARAQGREITLHFAVLPAVGEEPLPDPLVVFAGGPGQAAREMAAALGPMLSEVREQRDIVLVDQRGMGASHPLTCPGVIDLDADEWNLDPEALRERTRDAITHCLAEWDADVSLYTQDLANQDIHEIVTALGYTRVNLYGGSWGTRSALLYAHQYPDQVRAVVLDGALPPSNPAPLYAAVDGERALRALFTDCAADTDCKAAFPDLEGTFRQAMERLGPEGIEVTVADPLTAESVDLRLTRETVGALLRNVLYVPELSRIVPWALSRAAEGDYRSLLGVSSFFNSATSGTMTLGATLAIFCAEEIARGDRMGLEIASEGEPLLGSAMLDGLRDGCAVWPETSVPAIYDEAIGSQAPALVLSGDLDPITPPRWGEGMAELFPNGRHLVAPSTGHNVTPVGCAPDLIAEFLELADASALDASCLEGIERPTFFVDVAGPAMVEASTTEEPVEPGVEDTETGDSETGDSETGGSETGGSETDSEGGDA